ncbi:MAG: alpha-glucuronidase family glycosyl hydrolase, partial [Bacteroidales bacterium]
MRRWGWIFMLMGVAFSAMAEDGYKLWLRYSYKDNAQQRVYYSAYLKNIYVGIHSPIAQSIREELSRASADMLRQSPTFTTIAENNPTLIITTPDNFPILKKDDFFAISLSQVAREGYIIGNITLHSSPCLVITSMTEQGLLYGTFHLLRMIAMNESLEKTQVVSSPRIHFRVLNHWDNPDGSIERGYAGKSLWYGSRVLDTIRIKDYARANASLGINTVVINNVNATPAMLADTSLFFAARLANIFRRYGIRIMLSINFSSPKYLGGLPTSDPLNPQVSEWWQNKIKQIYHIIPDFAGFLVKANSEGLAGPQDYGRTHADGANMLARAFQPYGGI